MKIFYLIFLLLIIPTTITAQTYNQYKISFNNAVHHEAIIEAEFSNLENNILELRMSRTSPGRYALHEFAKNVYDVKTTDSKGNNLTITRPNPYSLLVNKHDGTVNYLYFIR